MSDIAYPYKTVTDESLGLDGWYENGSPPRLVFRKSWDYLTTLILTATLRSNPASLFSDTGIPLDRMTLTIFCETGAGAFRERFSVFAEKLSNLVDKSGNAALSITLPGDRLSGILTLHTDITLKDRYQSRDPLIASIPGSRLWSNTSTIRLEGSIGRFPMAMVPFSKFFPHHHISNAPWYLQWNPSSFAQPLAGAALLYLNEECAWLKNAVDQKDPAVIAILTADAVASMAEAFVLQTEDALDGYDEVPNDAAIRVLVESVKPVSAGGTAHEILGNAVRSIPLLRAKLMSQFMEGM